MTALGFFATAAAGVAAVLLFSEPILTRLDYSAATERLVTGIAVGGTPSRPIIYVSSSDPRTGAVNRRDRAMDTNSGILSRLSLTRDGWERTDLVRGLPRSRLDHSPNGLVLDAASQTLYVVQGANTNKGAPSERFGHLPESPLSGTVLALDLQRIGGLTFDLPTRSGRDLFGGRGGANHALLPVGGPIRVVATGLRNPYDAVLTQNRELLVTVNGANAGAGDRPLGCSDQPREGGTRELDALVRIRAGGFYGHANPARRECGEATDQPLARFRFSTNGIAEVRTGPASRDLLLVSLDGALHRIRLEGPRGGVVQRERVRVPGVPLDVTVQGPADPLPGTVWMALYLDHRGGPGGLTVLEPASLERASWRTLPGAGTARQEVSYVGHGGRFYLAGGGTLHQAFDPKTGAWQELAPLPEPLDHIQGVVVGDRIFYIGGLRRWPDEETGAVYVYDPAFDRFSRGTPMPRPRGAGGVAVHGGKVYYAGGLSDGRAVTWLDVFDPRSGRWRALPDMPRARDHFQAVFAGDRLIVTGGRQRDLGTELADTDAYDVGEARWVTGLAPIPTPRGGFAAALVGAEMLVAGGEVPGRALPTVEAYDPGRDRWRTLPSMPTGRHGIQAALCGDNVLIAGGGVVAGSGPVDAHEAFDFGPRPCEPARAEATDTGGKLRDGYVLGGISGAAPVHPTSLQIGPDGRLYVAQQNGTILVYTVRRRAAGAYEVVATETIDLVRELPNHDDDGSSATDSSSLITVIRDLLGV